MTLNLVQIRLANSAEPGVRDVEEIKAAPSGGELLTTFLGSDSLLWGCLALALIALFSVSRVISRRRDERKNNRTQRAQSRSLHEFLSAVREEHATAQQGVWHYDFSTGAQQFSDDFKRVLIGTQGALPQEPEVHAILDRAGIDLVTLAHDHFEETGSFEIKFTLCDAAQNERAVVLKACNLRDGEGQVQRMVAVITEAVG